MFETAQSLLNLVSFGRHTVRLPADDAESVDVRTTQLGRVRLVVRPWAAPA